MEDGGGWRESILFVLFVSLDSCSLDENFKALSMGRGRSK